MPNKENEPRKLSQLWTAVVEIAFIIFLFYANLLMGEFLRSSNRGKSFWSALLDVMTIRSFSIAVFAASVGFLVFNYLRKRI